MIKKGIVIALFSLSGVVLASSVAVPICYAVNEQYQSIDSSQPDPSVFVKDGKVYLASEENPLFPGDTRVLEVRLDMTTAKNSKVTLYYDSYTGEGYEYLSLTITWEGQTLLPITAIEKAKQETPLEFNVVDQKNTLLEFHYTLSKDVPSTHEDLSFSFAMHMSVNWR